MEMVDDVCESEGVCEVMCNSPSDEPEGGESMETHECEEKASTEDVLAAAQDTEGTSTVPRKPQYSYRLAFKSVCVKTKSAIFKMFAIKKKSRILYKLNMCKVLTTVHVYYSFLAFKTKQSEAQIWTAVLFSLRIPNTVCFGHGSVRGFGGRRGRRKWSIKIKAAIFWPFRFTAL